MVYTLIPCRYLRESVTGCIGRAHFCVFTTALMYLVYTCYKRRKPSDLTGNRMYRHRSRNPYLYKALYNLYGGVYNLYRGFYNIYRVLIIYVWVFIVYIGGSIIYVGFL